MARYLSRADQVRYIHRGRKAHAKAAGVIYEVDDVYLIRLMMAQHEECVLTGLPFAKPRTGLSPFSPSLDRLLPHRGYVEKNLRWILHGVNDLKGVGTDDDVIAIAQALLAHRAGAAGGWGAPPSLLHPGIAARPPVGLREPRED